MNLLIFIILLIAEILLVNHLRYRNAETFLGADQKESPLKGRLNQLLSALALIIGIILFAQLMMFCVWFFSSIHIVTVSE